MLPALASKVGETVADTKVGNVIRGADAVASSVFGSNIDNVKNVILEKILIEDMLNGGYLLIDEYDLDVRYYLNKIREYKI